MSELLSLTCKQKLCSFPEEKNSNRESVSIHKIHKKFLSDRNSQIAKSNPV